MIELRFDDEFLVENYKAITELRSLGFTDEQIQELYNKQVEHDKKAGEQHD